MESATIIMSGLLYTIGFIFILIPMIWDVFRKYGFMKKQKLEDRVELVEQKLGLKETSWFCHQDHLPYQWLYMRKLVNLYNYHWSNP